MDSFRDDRTVDKSIKTTFIHFYIKGQKHPLAGFCCWCFQDGKGYFTVFCSVLKVKGEERLSLSNSDACHSYITIIHIYFISRSFDTGSYRFLSGEKNRAWYVHVVRGTYTHVVHGLYQQSNVIIRSDVPNRLPRGSRLHLSNSVFVCRGISRIRLFSLSLFPQEK